MQECIGVGLILSPKDEIQEVESQEKVQWLKPLNIHKLFQAERSQNIKRRNDPNRRSGRGR
jgi:hypothetical protein